jgi:anti-sigma B factor antagonist
MTINIEKSNETVTLKIEGRLDTITAPDLEKTVNGLPEETKDLVLDMNRLEYISSAGLRVLLGAQKKMNKIGTMKLVGVCDAVMEILEMTGFADILVIE